MFAINIENLKYYIFKKNSRFKITVVLLFTVSVVINMKKCLKKNQLTY